MALLACSDSSDLSEPSTELSPPDELELLEAIGYVNWHAAEDLDVTGVTHFEAGRVSPGFNLYTNDVDEVYLEDLDGRRIHSWHLQGMQDCEYAELLPDGSLEVSENGEIVRQWDSYAALSELKQHFPPTKLDSWPSLSKLFHSAYLTIRRQPVKTFDYFHLNSVEILAETELGKRDPRFRKGNVLVSLRNVNVIFILDGEDFSIQWSWGAEHLEMQHMPTQLESGNILVFDNGIYREFTRVLEVEPVSGEIDWKYEGDPKEDFLSKWRGSNQRLPNGNTLICNSDLGRVFELAPNGDLVWEFWSKDVLDGKRRRIYRFLRFTPSFVENARSAATSRLNR